MDDYLFITLAKLKSDRLALERQQRAAESGQLRLELVEPVQTPRPARPHPVRTSLLTRWFSQQPSWREQS